MTVQQKNEPQDCAFETKFSQAQVKEAGGKEAGGKEKEGHRQRLRTRFIKDGGKSMPDYELLELIIIGVMPRGDAKPLAKRLLQHFGSYAAVLSADVKDLRKIKQCGDAVIVAIKAVHISLERFLSSDFTEKNVVYNWETLLKYAQISMGWQQEEHLRLLLLNDSRCVIFDEKISKGTVNEVSLYHREIIKHAIEERATGLILIHNHPSGKVSPSKPDLKVTKSLESVLQVMGIELFDHLIVSGKQVYSFRNNGLLLV